MATRSIKMKYYGINQSKLRPGNFKNVLMNSNLTTGAKCAYDNNYSYVGCGETG